MKNLVNLLLTFWAAACVCAEKETYERHSKVAPRIWFGDTAFEGQFPYQASIYYGGGLHCGASIIHKRWVLTAAHCKLTGDDAFFSVKVGTIYSYGEYGQNFTIEKFIKHEKFDLIFQKEAKARPTTLKHVSHDIALIRLGNDIQFNDFVKSIKLAKDDADKYENVTAVVSGLGCTEKEASSPEELQYLQVKVIPDAECKKTWAELNRIILRYCLCTSVINEKSLCNGDSGGPLVFQDKQIGIAIRGDPDHASSIPNVYTRVSSFISWIDRQLKSYSDTLP